MATITVGTAPDAIVISPNGVYAYVMNALGASPSISVITIASNTVTATIAVTTPSGLAITPNGLYVYVSNYSANTVSVISTASNTITATVTVGNGPYGISVTPNGEYAYVANGLSGSVSVIATATNTIFSNIITGNSPYAVATLSSSGEVYVTNNLTGVVMVITTATNTVVNTIPVGSDPFAITLNSQLTPAASPLFEYDPNSGPNSKVVQVSNQSGLNLNIQSGGQASVVSPYNVLTVPTYSGNAIAISFTSTNVQAAGSVTLYWCTPHDLTPLSDGPLCQPGRCRGTRISSMDEVTIHEAVPEVTTRVRLSTGGKIILASFAGIFVGLAIAVGLTKIGQEYEPRGQHALLSRWARAASWWRRTDVGAGSDIQIGGGTGGGGSGITQLTGDVTARSRHRQSSPPRWSPLPPSKPSLPPGPLSPRCLDALALSPPRRATTTPLKSPW